MLGIEGIETYLPDNEVYISNLSERLNLNRFQLTLLTRFHGLEKVRYKPDQSLEEMLINPIEKMLSKVERKDIKYIIYAHTITTVAPYPINILENIKKTLGLENATSFSITHHHCSSAITAIEVAKHLIGDSRDKVLLLTGEKPFTPKAQLIPNTTVMGEGSACCLISANSKGNQLLSTNRMILGAYHSGVNLNDKQLKQFEKEYTDTLVKTIEGAISKANLGMGDINHIIPHNVNRSSWLKVIDALPLKKEIYFLDNISEIGHCYCSDPFLNLHTMLERGSIRKGEYYVFVTVGLGATFSAAVFQH
ncbi:3-oxoacyl-[acyl-carrier-protein] synthase III C-terminal domain-containing protein [Rossellomorea aquimaris]|jgi:3-oxoacyl-[acyl-carrier-protein] synthase III|uniref:Beta-ketoacyl-[acyl-carrier-protein] synthase III C-terminal domain-containing protein n=1 Tax=Rossellomorea aquimaris TaxID=189382 RepID=A0A1J6VVK3_9BACI|nr:3-oxoacyl-[acyl-carrier-protein] synthase III C-terminal domain-containing protein [Rossellomorea aquimaris]OIU69830.1 hypothetical protein BHE18_02665 [Rossellomorea aquimaris]